jgi:hypothetical protein
MCSEARFCPAHEPDLDASGRPTVEQPAERASSGRAGCGRGSEEPTPAQAKCPPPAIQPPRAGMCPKSERDERTARRTGFCLWALFARRDVCSSRRGNWGRPPLPLLDRQQSHPALDPPLPPSLLRAKRLRERGGWCNVETRERACDYHVMSERKHRTRRAVQSLALLGLHRGEFP